MDYVPDIILDIEDTVNEKKTHLQGVYTSS